jgi:phosphonate transport system ATP-binding protein
VTKIYDNTVLALDKVSFHVPKGQFLAVVGLSGSGKSTLLRCINRLIEPTSGQILWNGVDITAASPEDLRRIRRKIGMIFQHFNLVLRSTVVTNVLTGRLGYTNPLWSLLNRFSSQDVEMALKQLERVGIRDKAYVRADELSGGQQQRCPGLDARAGDHAG